MGLLKILFCINLLFFPVGELLRISFFGIETKLLDVSVFFFSLCWFSYGIVNKKINKTIYFPALGFIFMGFLSLAVNIWEFSPDQILKSSVYLFRWISYIGMFAFILSQKKDFKSLVKKLIIFTGIFIVGLGFIQFIFYQSLRNLFYLGWDEHLYRMFSIFLDPNFAGAFFVLFFLFLIDKVFSKIKKKNYLIVYSGISIATLIAVLLTYSRSAFTMLVIGTCTYLILTKRKKMIFFLLTGFILLTFILPKAYKTEGTNFFRTFSSEARIVSYKQSIEIIKDNPIFGVGFNAYRFAKERHEFSFPRDYKSHSDASADNSFLFILATTGVLGFISYIYMWYRIGLNNKKSALILSSILALFVNSLFINSLFYTPILFWLWIVIGVTEST
ncbi:MAG: O-antigen ligase family protein [Patescibacteria group bacterium]